ncbi:hypothetical protein [Desulfosporosinus nitroreducens]|uniref:DUF2127 domain-containing protein n=1 Tax=Desulfosporosinus nitroreducens TaxID=2018668 RepID=A0ABT8QXL3_9FIRM|nr:hypothetical protein [Desulfosporosinus nitroreducens]MDO0826092.1 hypothetical protein [Desulfosporosinus nitroreducens]
MKLDKPLLAIAVGYIALIPAEIFTQIMKYYKFTSVSAFEAMSMLWTPEGSFLLGILAALGIASWGILIIYYSAKIWGTDYFPLKSMFLVMTIESLIFSIFGVLNKNPDLVQNISGNYVHAFGAAIGGLCVGLLLKRYVFPK